MASIDPSSDQRPNQSAGTGPSDCLPEIVIVPPKGWLQVRFGELWKYRDLLGTLAWRHIQVRYKQAILGGLWAILQPIAAALAFTLVFQGMVGSTDGIPYLVFAYSGVLLWQLLASIVGTGSMSLVDNTPLITKVFFPRLLIPLSVVAYSLVDFAIGSVILAVLLLWYGASPGMTLILLPIAIGGVVVCGLGVSVFLSALTIKYRDFRFVVPFLVQIWFFLSPVIYPTTRLPQSVQGLIYLNPMAGWLDLFRYSLFGGAPNVTGLIISTVFSVFIAVFGISYFRQVENTFADII